MINYLPSVNWSADCLETRLDKDSTTVLLFLNLNQLYTEEKPTQHEWHFNTNLNLIIYNSNISNHNSQTFLVKGWFTSSCKSLSSLITATGMHLGSEDYPTLIHVPSMHLTYLKHTIVSTPLPPTTEVSLMLGKPLNWTSKFYGLLFSIS